MPKRKTGDVRKRSHAAQYHMEDIYLVKFYRDKRLVQEYYMISGSRRYFISLAKAKEAIDNRKHLQATKTGLRHGKRNY